MTIRGKGAGLGGAVDLLLPDGLKKDHRRAKKLKQAERERVREGERELEIHSQSQPRAHSRSQPQALTESELPKRAASQATPGTTTAATSTSATPRTRHTASAPRSSALPQRSDSLPRRIPTRRAPPPPSSPPVPAPAGVTRSPPRPPRSSPRAPPDGTASMSVSAVPFIAARVQPPLAEPSNSCESSEVESLGTDSSAIFYGGTQPQARDSRRPTESPPPSVTSSSYPLRRSPQVNLGQRQSSVADSDTSCDDYATAESHAEAPWPVVTSDASGSHTTAITQVTMQEADPFATIRQRKRERRSVMDVAGDLEQQSEPSGTLPPLATETAADAAAALSVDNARGLHRTSMASQLSARSAGSQLSVPTLEVPADDAGSRANTFGRAKSKASSKASLGEPGLLGANGSAGGSGAASRMSTSPVPSPPPRRPPRSPSRIASLSSSSSVLATPRPVSNASSSCQSSEQQDPGEELGPADADAAAVASTAVTPSNSLKRSPVQTHPVCPVPTAEDGSASADAAPNWYYHPTSSTGKRSIPAPLDHAAAESAAVNSIDKQNELPPTPITATELIHSHMMATSDPMRTMSSASLNNVLVTLCTPSLSAVTGGSKNGPASPVHRRARRTKGARTRGAAGAATNKGSSTCGSLPPTREGEGNATNSPCSSDYDSESDSSSIEDDSSPAPVFDFTTPRPGFVPAAPEGLAPLWVGTPLQPVSPERNCFSPESQAVTSRFPFPPDALAQAAQEAQGRSFAPPQDNSQKRSLDVVSDVSTPQMSNCTSGYDTVSTDMHSVKSSPQTATLVCAPCASGQPPMPDRAVDEVAEVLALGNAYRPPSQFARASFGCEGSEADRERSKVPEVVAAAAFSPLRAERRPSFSGSETDSDGEYERYDAYPPLGSGVPRASLNRSQSTRDAFFGSGSAASRHARHSHASLNAIPVHHEDLMYDLSHLQTAVFPAEAARKSLVSLQESSVRASTTSPFSTIPRQRSLVSLIRKRDREVPAAGSRSGIGGGGGGGHGIRLRRVRSSPRLAAEPTVPMPAAVVAEKEVVDNDREFSTSKPPSQRRMWEAGTSFLYDEDGNVVCFGDLFPTTPRRRQAKGEDNLADVDNDGDEGPPPRTVVFFIRSFWCGLCQDYTLASIARLDPELLKRHNVRVVVIGPGHWKMLRPYRTLFKCPFQFYTDPSRRLYHVMGMIKYGTALKEFARHRAAYHQASIPAQAAKGVARGLMHMPLGYNVGNLFQLGGEFVLGPGYRCEFAHRMRFFGDHMEARDVLKHAGVDHPEISRVVLSEGERAAREELNREALAATRWEEERDKELDRMKRKKAARRIASASMMEIESTQDADGDTVDLTDIPLTTFDRRAAASDDTRSEWGEYVQSVLNPNNRASYVFVAPIPYRHPSSTPGDTPLSRVSPVPPRPEWRRSSSSQPRTPDSGMSGPLTPVAIVVDGGTDEAVGGGRIPVPQGVVAIPHPRTRLLSLQTDAREAPALDPRKATSPKPPHRPRHVPSSSRKPVPRMDAAEEAELVKRESVRSSIVLAGAQ